jgi:hypothetical protein
MILRKMPDGEKKMFCATCVKAYRLPFDGDVVYRP